MSSLLLQSDADFLVHDTFTADTEDNEDHTFNGVMFNVMVHKNQKRPTGAVVIDAVHVRGGLGKMTVWKTEGGFEGKQLHASEWTQLYKGTLEPSWGTLQKLKLDPAIVLLPNEKIGLYVHSNEDNDEGIVYDNQRSEKTHADDYITLLPGMAHLASEPFSDDGPWWGSPWRRRRQFVGKLSYGVRYKLWSPRNGFCFPRCFRRGASSSFAALAMGWQGLPTDVVLYILHLCRYDWFDHPDLSDDEEDKEEEHNSSAQPLADTPCTARTYASRATWLARLRARVSLDYSRFDHISDNSDDDALPVIHYPVDMDMIDDDVDDDDSEDDHDGIM
mmetsp:Transcript_20365/g.26400  ORF Transcript_20365/g.26400 Transcript_20365/m.26400 type:complete len:332 (+) Transcript_20365:59-1054(+)|eukprot:CAMPEP_0197290822 /NCGR_PEP_ID=MMETSP0890-20130614/10234_1 /TAXON_ID=44058 ORGANISM="Aureoumbra lagunensis, Strain CCMP1510" /NCGR_SAMPLE_ID=MMETSP0890 /ASSEMBLY_ACC=CAM_ASM_000533 /LENGTH=331 /DNA_ID=CAMNT_0042763139 /DNA_START=57 /DNA_END=1052 /DNA_ORIENTATION=+